MVARLYTIRYVLCQLSCRNELGCSMVAVRYKSPGSTLVTLRCQCHMILTNHNVTSVQNDKICFLVREKKVMFFCNFAHLWHCGWSMSHDIGTPMTPKCYEQGCKTGPNRPVQPVRSGTGPVSGPIGPQNRSAVEPENRTEPTGGPVL